MSVYHIDYRPRSIKELDIPSVAATLEKVFASENIPRAFLFCGPKGSGKTSAARVIARLVNKIDPEDRKNYIDIMELDAASNRGIDDIRTLREKAYLLPAELPKKVFIVDEVHMLTKEAFNALLKILEEPPEHTLFILCTTDPQDLPETVLSRLFRVDFRKATKAEVVSSLQKVIKGEKLKISDSVLEKVYEKSEGSFRNAAKLLQEFVISDQSEEEFFASKWGSYGFENLEEDLLENDSKKILQSVENLAVAGVDMEAFTVETLAYFQKQLLTTSKLGDKLQVWLVLLLNACRQVRDCPVAQLPLQLAVVDFLKDGSKVEKKVIRPVENEIKSVGAAVAPEIVDVIVSVPSFGSSSCSVEDIQNCWLKLIGEVGVHNRSVGAFLKAANPREVLGEILRLEVFYDFHKQQLQQLKNKQLVERCLELVIGKQLVIEFIKGEKAVGSITVEYVAPVSVTSIINENGEVKKSGEGDVLYDVAKEIFG